MSVLHRACPHGCPLTDPDLVSLQELKRQWAALDIELRAATDEMASVIGRVLVVSSQRMRLVSDAALIIDKLEAKADPNG